MATQWKQNTDNAVTIDLGPYDVYNETGFTLHYKLKGDVTTTDSGATWVEMHNPVPVTNDFITTALTATGSATITIDSATGVAPGQVYQAGSVFIYVSSLSGNTLTLRRVTREEIADTTTFTLVGNTGIYETSLSLSELGQYTIIIANPSVGLLNEATKVEIIANTVDDLAASISAHDTIVSGKLEDIQSALGVVDTSITGKLII